MVTLFISLWSCALFFFTYSLEWLGICPAESVSNIHGLRKFAAIHYTFEKRIKRSRSFTGRNNRKRSTMYMWLWLTWLAAARRNGKIVYLFEIGIVERMIKQLRKMAEDSRHSLSAGSGPTAASGFHAQSNSFSDIGFHTAQRIQTIERQVSFRKRKDLILMILEVPQTVKSGAADWRSAFFG